MIAKVVANPSITSTKLKALTTESIQKKDIIKLIKEDKKKVFSINPPIKNILAATDWPIIFCKGEETYMSSKRPSINKIKRPAIKKKSKFLKRQKPQNTN